MKNLQFGKALLLLAASVNLSRWIGIYTISPTAPQWVYDILPFLDAISGLLTGLAIAGGLVFVGHRLGKLQPFLTRKVRGKDEYISRPNIPFWGAAISGLLILILSAFLLPPYIRMSTPESLRAEIGQGNWFTAWSIMAVLVGDLVILAIALADSKAAEFASSEPQATAPIRSEPKSEPQATAPNSQAKSKRAPCRYCKDTIISQTVNGYNAHRSKCKAQSKWPTKKNVSLAESLFSNQK